MSDFVDGVIDDLAEKLAPAVQTVTDRIRDELKELVGDAYPPASEPGTPPHKRTGGYQDSIQSESVTSDSDTLHGAAYTDSQLGEWLENGTSRGLAPRPHFSVIADKWDGQVVSEIESEI